MNIPYCSPSTWKSLYDAAGAFRHVACWQWMSDSDLFGVRDPESGEIGYCCILGQLGEVFGLVVYLGSTGLEQHRKIQSGKFSAGSPDFLYNQNCLTAWFGSRSDLEDADRKVINELGLKFRGSHAWPQFRSLQPGYIPWHLTENEAAFLTLCLEQARHVALDFENDLDFLSAPAKNLYLVRVKSENEQPQAVTHSPNSVRSPDQQLLFPEPIEPAVHQWKNQWLSPAPLVKATVKPFPLDELRLQRIKKNSQAQHGVWEIDAFYTPAPVDGSDRPFFPYTFLCADHDSRFILGTVLAEPRTWETEFPKTFLDRIEEHRFLPGKLSFRKDELGELFEPLADQLGIEIDLTKKLPAVDAAKRELLKFIKRQR